MDHLTPYSRKCQSVLVNLYLSNIDRGKHFSTPVYLHDLQHPDLFESSGLLACLKVLLKDGFVKSSDGSTVVDPSNKDVGYILMPEGAHLAKQRLNDQ